MFKCWGNEVDDKIEEIRELVGWDYLRLNIKFKILGSDYNINKYDVK